MAGWGQRNQEKCIAGKRARSIFEEMCWYSNRRKMLLAVSFSPAAEGNERRRRASKRVRKELESSMRVCWC